MEKPWQTDDWFVSPYNFEDTTAFKSKPPKTLRFHDVTMRDGEQQAGVVLTKHDKVAMGRALNRAGIDRIEVGIPGTSLEDREAMRALIAASSMPTSTHGAGTTSLTLWQRRNAEATASRSSCLLATS